VTERTFTPKIHALPNSKSILIDLGLDNYLRMSSEVAKKFAGRLLTAATEAEGSAPAHRFIIEVEA
jgi:hypothetical protein